MAYTTTDLFEAVSKNSVGLVKDILQSGDVDLNDLHEGKNIGLFVARYLVKHHFDVFKELIKAFEKLSVNNRYELLKINTTKPKSSLGWYLWRNNHIEPIKALTSDFKTLPADSRFKYLSALFISPDTFRGVPNNSLDKLSVAGFYLRHEMYDEFYALVNDLDEHQLTIILLSFTLNKLKTLKYSILHELCLTHTEVITAILDQYNSSQLAVLYKTIPEYTPEYYIFCYLSLKCLASDLTRSLTLPSIRQEDLDLNLKKLLAFSSCDMSEAQKKSAREILGMLLSEASRSKYKSLFSNFFSRHQNCICTASKEDVFAKVTQAVPDYGLEGLAQFCLLIGFGSNACNLSEVISHARLCQRRDSLQATREGNSKKTKAATDDYPAHFPLAPRVS